MSYTVDNSADVLDSRNILERLAELESTEDRDEEENTELATLTALIDEIDQNAGDSARDGVTLIRDSYFEDYARELAEDIGAIDRNAGWPNSYIDWEAAADALKQDYSTVDFDGVDYWVRS